MIKGGVCQNDRLAKSAPLCFFLFDRSAMKSRCLEQFEPRAFSTICMFTTDTSRDVIVTTVTYNGRIHINYTWLYTFLN